MCCSARWTGKPSALCLQLNRKEEEVGSSEDKYSSDSEEEAPSQEAQFDQYGCAFEEIEKRKGLYTYRRHNRSFMPTEAA